MKTMYEVSPEYEVLPEKTIKWLEEIEFFEAPASANHHGNYKGALAKHSERVAERLQWLTDTLDLKWSRKESPIIVGLLHDVCKTDDYWFDGTDWNYADDKILDGHGDKSVIMLAGHMDLTEEEVMCIRFHMGAFTDKEEWKYYTKAVHRYPNVLYTHMADMLASQVDDI